MKVSRECQTNSSVVRSWKWPQASCRDVLSVSAKATCTETRTTAHHRASLSTMVQTGSWPLQVRRERASCDHRLLLERDGDQAREVIHQRIHLYALQAGLLRYTVFQVPSLPTMIPSSLPKTLRNSTKHRALITTLQVHIFRKTVVEPSLNSTRSFWTTQKGELCSSRSAS